MVASMSRGKKAYLQYEVQLSEAIARLATLREDLKVAIDADAESYNVVMKAYRAARENDDGGVGVNAALRQATSVPLGVAERSAEAKQIAESLKPITNPNMASDLITAVALAQAAVTGALSNVDINLGSMKSGLSSDDDTFVADTRARASNLKS
jgi:formiminotetrahydrofolate cyclodeaminase